MDPEFLIPYYRDMNMRSKHHSSYLYIDISSMTCLFDKSHICSPLGETVSTTFRNFFPEDLACKCSNIHKRWVKIINSSHKKTWINI